MSKTIRWGVLGAAAIATQRVMPALLEAPSVTLLALASSRARRRHQTQPSANISSVPAK